MFKFEKKNLLNLNFESCQELYKRYNKSGGTLGRPPLTYGVFITVSLPPNLLMGTMRGNTIVGTKFKDLPKAIQYEVCIRYFENVFMPEFKDPLVIMTYEYDKSGKVHLHCIVWDVNINHQYDLVDLQSNVRLHPVCQRIMTKHKLRNDIFNSIVKCDDWNKTLKYMDKDHSMKNMGNFHKGFTLEQKDDHKTV